MRDNSFRVLFLVLVFNPINNGKPLSIKSDTLTSQMQTLPGSSNLHVNVSRTLTRLN